MSKFKLSEIQATHILDMPLRRLTALEKEKLEEEKKELKQTIKDLTAILKSRTKQNEFNLRSFVKGEHTLPGKDGFI